MKLLFINLENEWGGVPQGIVTIAGYLNKNMPEVEIKIINKDYISKIEAYNPEVIGISAMSNEFYIAKQLADEIKKRFPKIKLLIGGVHITLLPEDLIETQFDIGIMGEGEKTLLELLEKIKDEKDITPDKIKKINGLVFRENEKKLFITPKRELIKDLDDIPFPAYDLLDIQEILLPGPGKEKLMSIRGYLMTSRGCPYNCSFCGSNSIWGKSGTRWQSPKRVVADIERWIRKYGVDHFIVLDDLFAFSKARIREIIAGLEKKKILGIATFEIMARANIIDQEMIDLLKRLNVTSVSFGFESGSEKMLRYLKKESVNIKQNAEAVRLCKKNTLVVTGFFIIGSPNENEEDLKYTFDFIKNNEMDFVAVFQATALPGTDFWNKAVDSGIINNKFYSESNRGNMKELNPEFLLTENISKEKFVEWYYRFKKERDLIDSKFKYQTNLKFKYVRKMISYRFIMKILKKVKDGLKRYIKI